MTWRVVGTTATGTSHAETTLPCQDRIAHNVVQSADGGTVLIVAVADGAGSAARAERGAEIVCETLVYSAAAACGESCDLDRIDESTVRSWFASAREAMRIEAASSDARINDYAATGLLCIASEHQTLCAQIGDGGIVVRTDGDALALAHWPEGGEYANQTYFVSDADAPQHIEFAHFDRVMDVIVFSDGLMRLALHAASRAPHPPFFAPLLREVRESARPDTDLERDLAGFLDSPAVNARTDDDKSLVIACRR